ncbi:hypothetical protein CLU79DRAFT_778893 [Phycomyces nitens]|nr:hypothetical protein CLU79DRAFT_778893 [Phycomyces nitens]
MADPNHQTSSSDPNDIDSDSDYSLDYEFIGPRDPNYRDTDDPDSDCSELSDEPPSRTLGFDMWDEDLHSTNDYTWQSNDIRLTHFIRHHHAARHQPGPSFWRKDRGWPRQLPCSRSTTNHDQSANAMCLVVSNYGLEEQLFAVYRDRILECGRPPQPRTIKKKITSPRQTTWLETSSNQSLVPPPTKKKTFIETHASSVHPPKRDNLPNTVCPDKFKRFTKYVRRQDYPALPAGDAYLALGFEPLCLAQKYGYMAIGGIEGEFELYCCMDRKQPIKIWGTKFKGKNNIMLMTNSVQIFRWELEPGIYQHLLIVCLNEAGVLIYSLPPHSGCHGNLASVKQHSHLRHFDRVPINDAQVSPNGKHMVCVGDDYAVFFIDIRLGNSVTFGSPTRLPISTTKLGSFTTTPALAYSSQYVAWNTSSTQFAHTSDSHHCVLVWDVSQQQIIRTIDSAGYTYAIQFHPLLENLLVFTNRYGYFHTVQWENNHSAARHEISLVSFRGEKDRRLRILAKINGIQWSHHGKCLYVSTKRRVLAYELQLFQKVPSLATIASKQAKQHLASPIPLKRKRSWQSPSHPHWESIPLTIKDQLFRESSLSSH